MGKVATGAQSFVFVAFARTIHILYGNVYRTLHYFMFFDEL